MMNHKPPGAMHSPRQWPRQYLAAILFVVLYYYYSIGSATHQLVSRPVDLATLARRERILAQCKHIQTPAGPPTDFVDRLESDRYELGTKPTLIKNAKIWTGALNGTEVVQGDLLLDKGIIKAVGQVPLHLAEELPIEVVDVHGAWVTPGLVDLHSHLGVDSAPYFEGAQDTNSYKAPILPWLRSLDGLNTHDAAYELARSGGVTTAQILPGSANDIGGQAFIAKLRETKERSSRAMLVEPPFTLNGSHFDHELPPRWRHMKHACGENPSRIYSMTRMDSGWHFRSAYDSARKIRDAQDVFCSKAEAGLWSELGDAGFPEDLQWEALVDVLRGKVKVSVHCYEAVDLDMIVRLTNEFNFPVASFHHAGETYLVPDLLKKTWGGAPAIALFASNFRKKREAYRGSEFAPRILTSHGLSVVMKSDHPVVNSRYLLNEAALAHYYGLLDNVALLSVTAHPADAMGLGHRLGRIQQGYDADVVIWDSYPLSLGATPRQVFIDGIPQFQSPHVVAKPPFFQRPPTTPDFDEEAADAVGYDGLPPLAPTSVRRAIFLNVDGIYTRSKEGLVLLEHPEIVVASRGKIACAGTLSSCSQYRDDGEEVIIDLEGGVIVPGLTTYGTQIGLTEILLEASTKDGDVYNPLSGDPPAIMGGSLIRAADGLQFQGRNTLLAYRGGVTAGVVAPTGSFIQGVSTAFSLGASNLLKNATIERNVALHVSITKNNAQSVSSQIAALRNLLFSTGGDEILEQVRNGRSTLVIDVDSADIMATLLRLKKDYEAHTSKTLQLTFSGAQESHLLAKEIAAAGVSVIVTRPKPYPDTWDQRRFLPGPPLTADSLVPVLLDAGVNVGIGLLEDYEARHLRFEVSRVVLAADGRIDRRTALELATTNLEKALGIHGSMPQDLVAYPGGHMFGFEGKVAAVISEQLGRIDLLVKPSNQHGNK